MKRQHLNRSFVLTFVAAITTLLAAGPVYADQLDTVKQRGTLRVGVKTDYKPFGWFNSKGQIVGFEIDLAKAVAKNILGSSDALELVPVVAANRIQLLNAGRIDLILATLGVTQSRDQVIDFTTNFFMMAGIVLVAPKDTDINSWEDLAGKTICGSQGNLYNTVLTQQFDAHLLLYTSSSAIFKSFQNGRCAAIAWDGPIMKQKVNTDAEWKKKYEIALPALEYIPIAGGIKEEEPHFRSAVNKAIIQAQASGVLVKALKKYNMGPNKYVEKQADESKEALKNGDWKKALDLSMERRSHL